MLKEKSDKQKQQQRNTQIHTETKTDLRKQIHDDPPNKRNQK